MYDDLIFRLAVIKMALLFLRLDFLRTIVIFTSYQEYEWMEAQTWLFAYNSDFHFISRIWMNGSSDLITFPPTSHLLVEKPKGNVHIFKPRIWETGCPKKKNHAIDTEHVHILVKFERRLSISVLWNRPFFTKKGLSQRFVSLFSPKLNGQPAFKFEHLTIYLPVNISSIIHAWPLIIRTFADLIWSPDFFWTCPQVYFEDPTFFLRLVHVNLTLEFPHEKCFFLRVMPFLVKEIINFTSNFTWRKVAFLPTEWCYRYWGFFDELLTFGAFKSVTVFGLYVEVTAAYSAEILLF
jgi:hypothetical protein